MLKLEKQTNKQTSKKKNNLFRGHFFPDLSKNNIFAKFRSLQLLDDKII